MLATEKMLKLKLKPNCILYLIDSGLCNTNTVKKNFSLDVFEKLPVKQNCN